MVRPPPPCECGGGARSFTENALGESKRACVPVLLTQAPAVAGWNRWSIADAKTCDPPSDEPTSLVDRARRVRRVGRAGRVCRVQQRRGARAARRFELGRRYDYGDRGRARRG